MVLDTPSSHPAHRPPIASRAFIPALPNTDLRTAASLVVPNAAVSHQRPHALLLFLGNPGEADDPHRLGQAVMAALAARDAGGAHGVADVRISGRKG